MTDTRRTLGSIEVVISGLFMRIRDCDGDCVELNVMETHALLAFLRECGWPKESTDV